MLINKNVTVLNSIAQKAKSTTSSVSSQSTADTAVNYAAVPTLFRTFSESTDSNLSAENLKAVPSDQLAVGRRVKNWLDSSVSSPKTQIAPPSPKSQSPKAKLLKYFTI